MFTIHYENYYNDFTRIEHTKSFSTLEGIYDWMKEISHNFVGNFNGYFPWNRWNDPRPHEWCSRIECDDYAQGRGWKMWIHKITTDGGIVYSDGCQTDAKFCAQKIEQWLLECSKKREETKNNPGFVEI